MLFKKGISVNGASYRFGTTWSCSKRRVNDKKFPFNILKDIFALLDAFSSHTYIRIFGFMCPLCVFTVEYRGCCIVFFFLLASLMTCLIVFVCIPSTESASKCVCLCEWVCLGGRNALRCLLSQCWGVHFWPGSSKVSSWPGQSRVITGPLSGQVRVRKSPAFRVKECKWLFSL